MNVTRLEWESKHFGYECAQVVLDSNTIPLETLETIKKRLVVIRSTSPVQELSTMLVDEKVVFLKTQLEKKIIQEIASIKEASPTEDLYELAFEAGKDSRFFKDKNFVNNEFQVLYKEWLVNSLNSKLADDVFVLGNPSYPKGFVTAKIKQSIVQIGLISILPKYQGQGLGQQLLNAVENFTIENSLSHIEVATQQSNTNACNFYQKNGFKLKSTEYIYHWWNK